MSGSGGVVLVSRIKIDADSGLVEIEGDEAFVSENLNKILPLLQARRVGLRAAQEQQPKDPEVRLDAGAEKQEAATRESAAKRTPRKVGKRPPAGASCRDRLIALRADGFFSAHRSGTDIVNGLAKKGYTHSINQVGASLTTMFEKGEIQRTKDDGAFKYFWDRG